MTTNLKSKDGNEVTCVLGWTLPVLLEPPAVRRRKKEKNKKQNKGPTSLDVSTEERTVTETDTDHPTDLRPPPPPSRPPPSSSSRER